MTETEALELLRGEFCLDIRNWKKYNPKAHHLFFKLSPSWFDDLDIVSLPPTAQLLYLKLCGLRASSPKPLERLSIGSLKVRVRLPGASLKVNLLRLWNCGLIILEKPYIREEKRRVEQSREEPPNSPPEKPPPLPPKKEKAAAPLPNILSLWNSNRGTLPEAAGMSSSRQLEWFARWQEKPDADHWTELIQRMARSKFCCGGGAKGWRADIDFFLKRDTPLKLLEGKYDDQTNASGKTFDQIVDEWEADERRKHGKN